VGARERRARARRSSSGYPTLRRLRGGATRHHPANRSVSGIRALGRGREDRGRDRHPDRSRRGPSQRRTPAHRGSRHLDRSCVGTDARSAPAEADVRAAYPDTTRGIAPAAAYDPAARGRVLGACSRPPHAPAARERTPDDRRASCRRPIPKRAGRSARPARRRPRAARPEVLRSRSALGQSSFSSSSPRSFAIAANRRPARREKAARVPG